jgi:murein DD-endopeptidase MepM/ murein hydrolase activator NlpD
MRGQSSGLTVIVVLLLALGGFGALLMANARPAAPVVAVIPTEAAPTEDSNSWLAILQGDLGSNSTPYPTQQILQNTFVPPTLIPIDLGSTTPVAASDLSSSASSGAVAAAMTPTRPNPTLASGNQATTLTPQVVLPEIIATSPPALEPPISRDPFGYDHFYFLRPVDSTANNAVLFYYAYGSNGPQNNFIVHRGIDMPNPIGQVVRAAGSGIVIWASDGLRTNDGAFENSPSYGNVVMIEHDFGFRGQKIWTLYAHLSAALVTRDQHVQAGDVIGLSGNSGRSSGPHVHFEVRVGQNRYSDTYNPVLWMVPYVNTGVIAGRVLDVNGNLIQDADVTIRNWKTGLQQDTTTTYIDLGTVSEVNGDLNWDENFVVADVPVGRYQVIATINGERVIKIVDVWEGMTSFVELEPLEQVSTAEPITPTPGS